MKEIWRDIKGYVGFYQISTYGNVRSLGRALLCSNATIRHCHGIALKPKSDKDGYLRIGLWYRGTHCNAIIHRLVAQAFIPNTENKPEVNHIDEDKTNNHASNLNWMTTKENINHGTHNERVSKAMTNGKLSKRVGQYTLDDKLVKIWPSTREVGRNGYDQGTVAACCRGNGKTTAHKGSKWKYLDSRRRAQT